MTTQRTALLLSVLLVCVSALTACTARSIVSLNDHPTRGVSIMEVNSQRSYFGVYSTIDKEFWLCTERGDTYECERTCKQMPLLFMGGDDIMCPSLLQGGLNIQDGYNTRGGHMSISAPGGSSPEPVSDTPTTP